MTTAIWKKANHLLKNKKVAFAGTGRNRTYYDVNDPEDSNYYLVEIETENGGTHLSCTCIHGSLKWEHLCAHKLAVIIHNADRLKPRGKKIW